MSDVRIVLRRSDHVIIDEINPVSFSMSRVDSGPSECALVVDKVPLRALDPDTIIEYWRDPLGNGNFKIDSNNCFLAHSFEEDFDAKTITIGGSSSASVIGRHIAPWYALNNQDLAVNYYSKKTMPADNFAKQIVRENFLIAATTAPAADVPSSVSLIGAAKRIFNLLKVESDTNECPSVQYSYPNQNIGSAVQQIAALSLEKGTRMFYDCEYDSQDGTMTFRTWAGIRGIDRRLNGTRLSIAAGSISGVKRKISYRNEVSWAHVGGSGQGKLRIMAGVAAADTAFYRSPWYPIEAFVDRQSTTSATELATAGSSFIKAREPVYTISCNAVQVKGAMLGVDYGLGDIVYVVVGDDEYQCRISKYEISYERSTKKETVSVPLQTVQDDEVI